MKLRPLCVVAASGLFLAGCGVVHTVYRGVTAPVRIVGRKASPTPAPTDVVHPGHPLATRATPTPSRRVVERTRAMPKPTATASKPATSVAKVSPTPTTKKTVKVAKASPTPAVSASQAQQQFPTGRPVPEKPGYVYSPSDPTKYVDVSGYAPGSKVKDPYSGKIFLVP